MVFQTCPCFLSTERLFLPLWQHERSSLPYLQNSFDNILWFLLPVYGTCPLLAMWWEAAWFWRRSFTLSIGATQVLLENFIITHHLWLTHMTHMIWLIWYDSLPDSTRDSTEHEINHHVIIRFRRHFIPWSKTKILTRSEINSQFWVAKWSNCAFI